MDGLIQRSLYWPDGSRRKYSDAAASKNTLTQTGHLLKAVVDKYNDDHKLSGVCSLPHCLLGYILFFNHLIIADLMHVFGFRIVHMN
jgi:hypothetical protein